MPGTTVNHVSTPIESGIDSLSRWNKPIDIQNKLLAADQQLSITPLSPDITPIIKPINKQHKLYHNHNSNQHGDSNNESKQSPVNPTINSRHIQSTQQWANSPANQQRKGKNLWLQSSPLLRGGGGTRTIQLSSTKGLSIQQPSPHYVTRDLHTDNVLYNNTIYATHNMNIQSSYTIDDDISKPSPGPSIRRLAEQFLSSLPDDSPSTRARQINHQHNNNHTNTNDVLKKFDNLHINDHTIQQSNKNSSTPPPSSLTTVDTNQSTTTLDQLHAQLHSDIESFAQLCTVEHNKLQSVRNKLITQTTTAIHSIWPTACIDVVGSVPCNIALPRSDLDFVVSFQPSTDKPLCYTYMNNIKQICNDDIFYATIHKSTDAPTNNDDPHTSSVDATQYYVHAGTLLKLIGGRKKSKTLFQSTKIQVFKDINLIRLRCGWTGISIDIWFPSSVITLQRSQLHCKLINTALHEYTELYTMSCVVKSFMLQQNLNSGYSGLCTFGIELMLIHWLQYRYHQNENTQSNNTDQLYSTLLYEFFVYYINFDYVNKSIDVNNKSGTPSNKPDSRILQSQLNPVEQMNDDSDDEFNTTGINNDTTTDRSINELYTLCIHDPYDTNNYLLCHSKPLINIIISFISAVHVIRPDTMTTVTLPLAIDNIHNQEQLSTYSLHRHVTNSNNPTSTLFEQLIDITTVLNGPSMKQCQNRVCGIMCPTQNKICFQCNYVFVTPNQTASRQIYNHNNNRMSSANRHHSIQQQRNMNNSMLQYNQQRINSRHYYNSQNIMQQPSHCHLLNNCYMINMCMGTNGVIVHYNKSIN